MALYANKYMLWHSRANIFVVADVGVLGVGGDGHSCGVLVGGHLVRVRLYRRRHFIHGRPGAGQLERDIKIKSLLKGVCLTGCSSKGIETAYIALSYGNSRIVC